MLFSNILVLLLIAVISEIHCSDPRYSRSSSKTCTKQVPTTSLPVNSPHVHARHGMTTVEACCEGYTENYYDQSICDPICDGGCVNGYCREPNQCECHPGYIKNLVGDCIPTCPNSCANGACYNGQCFCNAGYTLEPNKQFCVPYCQSGCGQNANCTRPGHCECQTGFRLSAAQICESLCPRGCGKGKCNNYGRCDCERGYEARDGTCQPAQMTSNPSQERDRYPTELSSRSQQQISCPRECGPGRCTEYGRCECEPGYELRDDTCQPQYDRNAEQERKRERMYKAASNIVQQLQCPRPCGRGKCTESGRCECEPGYELLDDTCQPIAERHRSPYTDDRRQQTSPPHVPYPEPEPKCPRPCGPGRCTQYGRCECESGYELVDDTCQPVADRYRSPYADDRRQQTSPPQVPYPQPEPQCPRPCGPGRCTQYGRCECDTGYELIDDTCQPVPERYRRPDERAQQTSPPQVPYPQPEPQCPRPCGAGRCTQHGHCECEPGYELVDETCHPVKERYRRPDERAQQTSPPQIPYSPPEPQCPRPCGPGRCTQYGRCECDPGYELVDDTCQPVPERYRRPDERAQQTSPPQVPYPQPEPQCPRPCGAGRCTQHGHCECEPGYELVDETCHPVKERYRRPDERAQQTSPPQIPYLQPEPQCPRPCGPGRCTQYGRCECESGYELVDDTCQPVPDRYPRPDERAQQTSPPQVPYPQPEPQCPRPCGPGRCTQYGRCECDPGYELVDETCHPVDERYRRPDEREQQTSPPQIPYPQPDPRYTQQQPRPCRKSCGYGRCHYNGECVCEPGYELRDDTCQVPQEQYRPSEPSMRIQEAIPRAENEQSCPRPCGNGVCMYGRCECNPGYDLIDETCQIATPDRNYQQQVPVCPRSCGYGRCNAYGECECDQGYQLMDGTCQLVDRIFRPRQVEELRPQPSRCPRACGHGTCTLSGYCECDNGYELRDETCQATKQISAQAAQQPPPCRKPCGRGRCNQYGQCECELGYELIDETCQEVPIVYRAPQINDRNQDSCPRPCGRGRCNEYGQCECEPGYELRDDTCQDIRSDPRYREQQQPSCRRQCGYGRCNAYGECECDPGYELIDGTCQYPQSNYPQTRTETQPTCPRSCGYGRCNQNGQCECEPGYELRDDICQEIEVFYRPPQQREQTQPPETDPYVYRHPSSPSCPRDCGHGRCDEYGRCECDRGYELWEDTCQPYNRPIQRPQVATNQPTCSTPCTHGRCSPYGYCECDPGFQLNAIINECECEAGYELRDDQCQIIRNEPEYRRQEQCPKSCGYGRCNEYGRCDCDPGYELRDETCQSVRRDPPRECRRPCGYGICNEYGLCDCDPGYELFDDTCQEVNSGNFIRRVTDLVHTVLSPRMSQYEPSCPRPCGNGRCTDYGECECDPGYELREDTCQTVAGYTFYKVQPQRSCPKPCGPGRCTEYGQCECESGYELKEDTCQPSYDPSANRPQRQESCPRPCGNGRCTIHGYCECEHGYELREDTCQLAPIIGNYRPQPQRSCPRSCGHGTCNEYGQCDCEPGYELKDETCQEYVTYPAHPRQQQRVSCPRSCGYGVCNTNGQCECDYGYELREDTCQEARHDQGHRQHESCPRPCGHGRCEYGRCVCESGFELRDDVCEMSSSYEPARAHSHGHVHCENACLNGYCSGANTCTCNPGYILQSGSDHICVPYCPQGCRNGLCIAPDQCSCNYGFRKDQRTQMCVRT